MKQEQLGTVAKKVIGGGKIIIVTDENVAPLYLDRCKESLTNQGFQVEAFIIPPGEASKNGETYLKLVNFLAENELTRVDGLVALGGGVVGDLTGFAGATYLRGIPVIQVPTTLLSMVDASVGGKTAINLEAGKNLAGAFHQPALIWRDSSLLESLPEEVFLEGMAEVIKYGVIADKELFVLLHGREEIMARMDEIIERCVAIKERVVKEDPMDKGARQLLNFGHTIGHAIEKASGYRISHGMAVAKGMAAMTSIAAGQGWCTEEVLMQVEKLLKTYGFDLSVDYDKDVLCDIIKGDKKRKGHSITLVVPETIGKCQLKTVSMEELETIL